MLPADAKKPLSMLELSRETVEVIPSEIWPFNIESKKLLSMALSSLRSETVNPFSLKLSNKINLILSSVVALEICRKLSKASSFRALSGTMRLSISEIRR